jgi:hypothetical protein
LFFEQLRNAVYDEPSSSLTLPDDVTFFGQPEGGRTMLMRPCYTHLQALLREMRSRRGRGARSVILGTPGTGKTLYGIALLYEAILEGRIVVYQQQTGLGLRLFINDRVYQLTHDQVR